MQRQNKIKKKSVRVSLCVILLLAMLSPLTLQRAYAMPTADVTTNIPDPDVNTTVIPGTGTLPVPDNVTTPSITDSSTVIPVPPATTPEVTTPAQATEAVTDSGGYLGWVITLIVIAIVAAILIGFLAFMPKKDK